MIGTSTRPDFAELARTLAEQARAIAAAQAEAAALERRKDPTRWRSARLLWPLFGKD